MACFAQNVHLALLSQNEHFCFSMSIEIYNQYVMKLNVKFFGFLASD